ncbi:hypothetical protein [Thalassospira sp.]|uniref:hypothetical protein n=1 Tax=Thalassospira sp. TaxID=1912094 RepID=UPI003AA9CF7B
MPDFNKERVAVTTGPVFLFFYLSLFANYDAFPTRIRAANQFVTGYHDCVSLSGANASAACCALLELAVIAAMSKTAKEASATKCLETVVLWAMMPTSHFCSGWLWFQKILTNESNR